MYSVHENRIILLSGYLPILTHYMYVSGLYWLVRNILSNFIYTSGCLYWFEVIHSCIAHAISIMIHIFIVDISNL